MQRKLSEETKEKNRIRSKEYREENKEKVREYSKKYKEENKENEKKYREENKEKIKETKKKYYEKNKDIIKEKVNNYYFLNKEKVKSYQEKNIEKIKEYKREKRFNNSLFRLSSNIRSSISTSIKSKRYLKESRTHEILGCSFEDFKIYLEKKFTEWMNWDNYGNPIDGLVEPNKTWDVDHIIPLASATNEDELLKLNHYTNLQPLCSYHNRFIKKDNY
jgi:hypothetical protein